MIAWCELSRQLAMFVKSRTEGDNIRLHPKTVIAPGRLVFPAGHGISILPRL